jgi:hypothetical protein
MEARAYSQRVYMASLAQSRLGILPRVCAMNNIAGLALPSLRNEKTLQTEVRHRWPRAQPIAYHPTDRVATMCVCTASQHPARASG